MEIILYDDVLPKLVCFSLSNFVKIMYFVFTPSKKLKLSDHMCVCTHCKGRGWSKTGVCHISVNIQQILIKFTPLVYCMKILQIVKFDLICIMVAMVTD